MRSGAVGGAGGGGRDGDTHNISTCLTSGSH